jgi:putative endonuclease
MLYYTYILKSKIIDRFYIGSCENLSIRLKRHNSGNSRSAKAFIPWEVVYFQEFENKTDALKREYELKRLRIKVTYKK